MKDGYKSSTSFTYLLLKTGIPLTARNYCGQTLLYTVCSVVPSYPERLLDSTENLISHLSASENLLHLFTKLLCSHDGYATAFAANLFAPNDEEYVESFKYLMELGLDPF
ncbi:uncharacterized protein ATNIH1004_002374 [Aspergillus tanneri]|uniref:Uncharacterized protein n=1 Tax=Aspergillus tanneri TaxID=1220188 RepID=A0A5M9MWJ1_9EURO|nr:uncharacterized protein ATNIH1004_002374 [Aspergillus tanneri]KAA8649700.1 hypothetical protein ATNIH1004_002374 [Aspergillus tanneri]